MVNNYSNIILLLIFAGVPLFFIIFLHLKTFLRNLVIIIKVNIFSFIIWLIGGQLAYKQNIWKVTYNDFLNQDIMGILVGDVIQSIIGTTLLTMVTILMFEAYQKGFKFRNYLLKKE